MEGLLLLLLGSDGCRICAGFFLGRRCCCHTTCQRSAQHVLLICYDAPQHLVLSLRVFHLVQLTLSLRAQAWCVQDIAHHELCFLCGH
jgi:hypothetical protein